MGFVATAVALLLVKARYGFENNDHQQYLLLPYREIYPDFLPGDWFTWQTTHYHLTFAWVIRLLHALSGETLFPTAVLLAHCVTLAGVGVGMLALARAAGLSRTAPWIALFLIAVVRARGIAGADVGKGVLLPAELALPAYLLACAAWLRERPVHAGAWLGVAGFMHANYAVLGPLSLAPLLSLDAKRARSARPIVAVALPFVVIAAPTLYVVVASFLVADAAPEQLELFFRVRAPHHYDIQYVAWLDVAWVASLLALATPVLARGGVRRLRDLALVLVAFLVIAWVGGVLELAPIVRAFPWRLSVPLCILLALAVGDALHRALAARDLPALALQLAGVCLLVLYAASNRDLAPSRVALLGALVPLAIGSAAVTWRGRRPRLAWVGASLAVVWVGLTLGGQIPGGDAPPFDAVKRELLRAHAVHTRWRPGGTMGALTSWARAHTANDARFLVPPGFIDFRLHARRGIYVDWKCTPMRGDELAEWKRRMLAAMGTKDFPALGYALRNASTRAYARRPAGELAALARRERLDYVVTSRPRVEAERAGLAFVEKFGPWRVFAVQAPD